MIIDWPFVHLSLRWSLTLISTYQNATQPSQIWVKYCSCLCQPSKSCVHIEKYDRRVFAAQNSHGAQRRSVVSEAADLWRCLRMARGRSRTAERHHTDRDAGTFRQRSGVFARSCLFSRMAQIRSTDGAVPPDRKFSRYSRMNCIFIVLK